MDDSCSTRPSAPRGSSRAAARAASFMYVTRPSVSSVKSPSPMLSVTARRKLPAAAQRALGGHALGHVDRHADPARRLPLGVDMTRPRTYAGKVEPSLRPTGLALPMAVPARSATALRWPPFGGEDELHRVRPRTSAWVQPCRRSAPRFQCATGRRGPSRSPPRPPRRAAPPASPPRFRRDGAWSRRHGRPPPARPRAVEARGAHHEPALSRRAVARVLHQEPGPGRRP